MTARGLTRRYALLGALAVLLWSTRAFAAAPVTEQELKSVLLFQLTQYITWPAVSNSEPAFLIGILRPDPLGEAINEVVRGEKVAGRPIRLVRASKAAELAHCPVVYVSPSAAESLPNILSALRTTGPTLTVGESEDFLRQGGMIRFRRTENRRIRLQINLEKVRAEGFNVSAQLLRISDVVTQGGGS